ncbi:MAG: hypothetical protein M1838_003504 [Thelocarpon superellum]|nr:MAG: hypothetical protein M1838_003504 [Thelocarpon superellum]
MATVNRASASPSIASLIDPPSGTVPTHPHPFSQGPRLQSRDGVVSSPSSPSTVEIAPPAAPCPSGDQGKSGMTAPFDDDARMSTTHSPGAANSSTKRSSAVANNGAASATPSPKPARQKAAPPPLPQGNGLLSSALFGGPTSAPQGDQTENRAPTIILEVAMNGETNKTINFARMAEERYGFNALYPRIAAQRDRLARVAAAGAALGPESAGASGDDMSVDLSDPESNVEMSGVTAPTGTGKVKKKRQTKTEEYDKDDPFVDDAEMLWEEQAAASKDGFFVYSGPLVPAGEKPTIERYVFVAPDSLSYAYMCLSAGGPAKRGRGRGRGGSTRGGGAGRGASASASGNSTRGGNVVRKPRITKADRQKRELEKQEREKMATLAAKPSNYVP